MRSDLRSYVPISGPIFQDLLHKVAGSRRRIGVFIGVAAISVLWNTTPAEAAVLRGLQEIITGILQVPLSTLAGTFGGPPVVGTVAGVLSGLVNGIGLVAHGALELAASGVSIAKTVAPYVLPFVL